MTHTVSKCDYADITGVTCLETGQPYSWRQNGERRFADLCDDHAEVMRNLFPITFRKQ